MPSPQTEQQPISHIQPPLTKHIALGCLVIDRTNLENHIAYSSSADHESTLSKYGQDVQRLQAATWIVTQSVEAKRLEHPQTEPACFDILRVYILPYDAGRRHIERDMIRLRSDLVNVIRRLDTSRQTWLGKYTPTAPLPFDLWASGVDHSLFFMFNNLASPSPSAKHFHKKTQRYIREAMEDVLEGTWLDGLQSVLYPYQRRSAAMMIEREEGSKLQLDPRLEHRESPDGSTYYYNAREMLFYKEPLYYESCRGGILAETMGLGKTLICLTLILATRHHLPKIPPEFNISHSPSNIRSLQQTAIRSIQRHAVPWQVELHRIEHHAGEDKSNVRRLLADNPPTYTIPILPTRWNRNTIMPPPKHLTLAATTLIVVPRNLCKQWQAEIAKHLQPDALRVLVMDDNRKELPQSEQLRHYDVVLFTRTRFEMETRDGADDNGRRLPPAHIPLRCRCPYIGSTRERDCRCLRPDDVYDSPLKHLHFKRLIIDEGHSFSASNTKAVSVANKLVVADHRWIISGTPAKHLVGVELSVTTDQISNNDATPGLRKTLLDSRRHYGVKSDEIEAIKSLGSLAGHFLQARPWYTGDSGEPAAIWDEHVYRHEDLRKRTYSCYSSSLQRTLESLVIKTRPEDVERDIVLPPLVHHVVRLDPSVFDKITANLFTLVLIANAVTSERTDQDYIFHKHNAKARSQLIANLRQSSFFWSGFSAADVEATIKTSEAYLNKENINCGAQDNQSILEAIDSAKRILTTPGWKTLGETHELGIYVDGWPEESAEFWSFDHNTKPLLTGLSQLLDAQRHINQQIDCGDLGSGLAGAGIKSLIAARSQPDQKSSNASASTPAKGVIPSSSLNEDLVLKRRASTISHGKLSPVRARTKLGLVLPDKPALLPLYSSQNGHQTEIVSDPAPPSLKRPFAAIDDSLDPSSEWGQARIIGTTSAKMSHLISQILTYHRDEKILIFYDGDHIAYYIAQALEVLHIKHEIYAKSLAASLKSEYVVRFDQSTEDRVLLMDVKQAAFGLNVASASRIYFVNPVCRPDMEAQAMKRAHRIGQTRPVHVETLLLKGTLEEKMHERAQRMTRSEHLDAKVLEDDRGMQHILQSARVIPHGTAKCESADPVSAPNTSEHDPAHHVDPLYTPEHHSAHYMAPLVNPEQLWGRPGWRKALEAAKQLQNKRPRKS